MTTQSLASRKKLIQLASPWFVPAGLVLCWQICAASGLIPHRVLPSPAEVLQAGFHLTVTGELPLHLWESFQRALAGLVLGGIIGFVFGLLNGLFGPANRLFDSSLQMLRGRAKAGTRFRESCRVRRGAYACLEQGVRWSPGVTCFGFSGGTW
jgi:ABC-type nitrate/sulfonate/bicarbonate transport system permease component